MSSNQGRIEDEVSIVCRFSGEIKLRGQHASAGPLNLQVIVPGATGIEPWNDRVEPPSAFSIGELVSAEFETAVVVRPSLIGMPQLD